MLIEVKYPITMHIHNINFSPHTCFVCKFIFFCVGCVFVFIPNLHSLFSLLTFFLRFPFFFLCIQKLFYNLKYFCSRYPSLSVVNKDNLYWHFFFIAGALGMLTNLRSLLWIKVQQYTSRAVQVRLFAHLHRWGSDRLRSICCKIDDE